MTDQTINRLTIIGIIFAACLLAAIVYLTYYNPPQPPPIDPRTISLKEVVKDSLDAANTLKITHTATVTQAKEMPKVKQATANKWSEVAKVRMSQSDSLQGVVLINRLNK